MNAIRQLFIAAFAATAMTTPFLHAQEVVRYVDMSEAFRKYYKTVRSQTSLKKQEQIYKDRAEEMAGEIKELRQKRDELEEKTLNIGVSEEVRDKSRRQARATENLYQAKQKQLRTFLENRQKELRSEYMDMRKDLVDEILAFIKDYATDNDIDTIFDVSGLTNNLLPTVIHHPQEREITEEIIKGLNKGHEDEVPEDGVEGVETPDITTD